MSKSDSKAERRSKKPSGLQVQDGDRFRPFMRGIIVHHLTSKGIAFEDAVKAANRVRNVLRGRDLVSREELVALIEEASGGKGISGNDEGPRQIFVGKNKAFFSKGFLSQSLLAAAIDPNDAFDVAQQIESELFSKSVDQIRRRDLRRLAFETLRKRLGEQVAQRYLVWRHYQEEPQKPVILLLGGTTGAGKTSLAIEVAHRLGLARVISTDSIRHVMRLMLSKELVPAIHSSSYRAFQTLSDSQGDDSVIQGFRVQANLVAVGVHAMIDRAIEENENLVMDGVSLVPGILNQDTYLNRAELHFLMVANLDAEEFENRFSAREAQASNRESHRYLSHIDSILQIQDHLLEVSEAHHVPIVDNKSFDKSVLSIIQSLMETLRKKESFDVKSLL